MDSVTLLNLLSCLLSVITVFDYVAMSSYVFFTALSKKSSAL